MRLGADRQIANDLVQRRNGDQLPFQNMAAPLGLAQQVFRAPTDDLDAMPQELFKHLLERQRARQAIHQREQNDADGFFERRKLIELVEHDMGVGVALEVDDQTNRLAGPGARFILDVGDALDAFVLDQLADDLVQAIARLLVGNFLDDDVVGTSFLDDVGAGTQA